MEAVAEADAHLKGLLAELEAVATLRQAKYHLDQVGRGRAIAVGALVGHDDGGPVAERGHLGGGRPMREEDDRNARVRSPQ